MIATLAMLCILAGELHSGCQKRRCRPGEGASGGGRGRKRARFFGGTALHEAAWNGDRNMAWILIAAGADPNVPHTEGGSTPLHYAILTNHVEIVKLLLEHGADVKARYRGGSTALHLAAGRGHTEIGRLLISKGAT
jgi:hypothetical protein